MRVRHSFGSEWNGSSMPKKAISKEGLSHPTWSSLFPASLGGCASWGVAHGMGSCAPPSRKLSQKSKRGKRAKFKKSTAGDALPDSTRIPFPRPSANTHSWVCDGVGHPPTRPPTPFPSQGASTTMLLRTNKKSSLNPTASPPHANPGGAFHGKFLFDGHRAAPAE